MTNASAPSHPPSSDDTGTKTTTCSSYSRLAVMLNNHGVVLLEKGFRSDAMETIRDAMTVLKSSCDSDEDGGIPLPSSSLTDFEAMMERASQRLSKATSPSIASSMPPHSRKICVVSFSEEITELESALRVCPIKDSVFFPVRIESISDENDTRLALAILLHNFGICVHTASSSRQCPSKIFRMCQKVLASSSSTCTDPLQQRRLYVLGFFMMTTLVSALASSGRQSEAIKYSQTHAKLKALVWGLLKRSQELSGKFTIHAAAAWDDDNLRFMSSFRPLCIVPFSKKWDNIPCRSRILLSGRKGTSLNIELNKPLFFESSLNNGAAATQGFTYGYRRLCFGACIFADRHEASCLSCSII